jgi:hypothetical protein
MKAVALAGLTRRHGVPYVALVPTPFETTVDEQSLPDDTQPFLIVDPGVTVLLSMPDADIRDPAWEMWANVFLAQAIAAPALTADEIPDELGDDRDHLALALLKLWGWFPGEAAGPLKDAALHCPPHELAKWDFADLCFTHTVLFDAPASASLEMARRGEIDA